MRVDPSLNLSFSLADAVIHLKADLDVKVSPERIWVQALKLTEITHSRYFTGARLAVFRMRSHLYLLCQLFRVP